MGISSPQSKLHKISLSMIKKKKTHEKNLSFCQLLNLTDCIVNFLQIFFIPHELFIMFQPVRI